MTNKILVTKKQRANALDALVNMWPSIPEANVVSRLGRWRADESSAQPPTCGTVACFGGWCEWRPSFRKQMGLQGSTWRSAGWHDVTGLFGPSMAQDIDKLLSPRGGHIADSRFYGSDHGLVTNRLKWLIENSKVAA